MLLIVWLTVALVFGFLGASVARNKGKDVALWGVICFLLPIAIILLLASSAQPQGNGQIVDVDARWDALVRYDPEVRAAVEKLAPYGNGPIMVFRDHYLALQDKNYLPQMIADIIRQAEESRVMPPGFTQVGAREGVPIFGNGELFWVDGSTFSSMSNAKAYALAVSKRARK